MCGVAGLWTERGDAEAAAIVRTMRDALASRGPDDAGAWFEPGCGLHLGHRRLSILDLSPEGRQPMLSLGGRYALAYNGEVYNYRQIRRELDERGPRAWRGSSDTEVLLAAIEEWGLDDALRRFVGMFALALWDRREERLTLVRDRLGIKPLVFARVAGDLVFASTLAAVHRHPRHVLDLDPEAVEAYLRFNYVPAPLTVEHDAWKVRPGTYVEFDSRNTEPRETVYWEPRRLLGSGPPPADGELEALLRDAVRLRMISDVPLGALLSGGIDSSMVVALMQEASTRPVRTFSIGNTRADYDESGAAAAVAEHLGCDHTALTVDADTALAWVPELPHILDEPFADSSLLPTYLVSRLAREQVTVALSGDGGDELFGGYNRHIWAPRVWSALRRVPPGVRRHGERLAALTPAEWINRAFANRLPVRLPGDKLRKALGLLPARSPEHLYELLQSQWPHPAQLLQRPPSTSWSGRPGLPTASIVERMMLGDLVGYLPDDILTKVDRASMAVSLEARVPLLDHRVVELAMRIPASEKIQGGRGKLPLRRLLANRVPAALWDRPKMGFGVPVGDWLRGPLRGWAEGLLDPATLRSDALFDVSAVRGAWASFLAGRSGLDQGIWGLLMFRGWQDSMKQTRVGGASATSLVGGA
ncbi:MAG: asparagine synthase (glutamine-hydrolyzing) [Sandaracinaceae bacterium]